MLFIQHSSFHRYLSGSRSQPITSLARAAWDTYERTHTHTEALILYLLAEATIIPSINKVFDQSSSRVIPQPTLTAINLKL